MSIFTENDQSEEEDDYYYYYYVKDSDAEDESEYALFWNIFFSFCVFIRFSFDVFEKFIGFMNTFISKSKQTVP